MKSREKRRVVYTTNFNNYDSLKPINFVSDIEFICFSDNKNLKTKGWKQIYFNDKNLSIVEKTRKIKLFPHYFLKDIEESLYVDGNISINKDPTYLFDKYLNNKNSLAIAKHPLRDCLFEEAEYLLNSNWFSKNQKLKLVLQLKKYKKIKMPRNFGLTENNIILRVNNAYQNKLMSELWWNEFINGCYRDQKSLPYIIWKNNIEYKTIVESPRYYNEYFNYHLHKKNISDSKLRNFMKLITIRSKQNISYRIIYLFLNFLINLSKFYVYKLNKNGI